MQKSYSSWWISKYQFVYFSDLLPIWTFDVYIYWIKAMSRNCIGRLWHHAHPYDIFLFQLNSQRLNSYSRAMIVTRVCPKKRRVKQQGFNITIGFITVVTFGKQHASPLQLQACICVELLGLFRCCCRFPPQRKVLQPRFPLSPFSSWALMGNWAILGAAGHRGVPGLRIVITIILLLEFSFPSVRSFVPIFYMHRI